MKRNVRKYDKNSGNSYLSSTGKIIAKKQLGAGCGVCKYKCHVSFDEDYRKGIFHSFWAIGDINHQRQYIVDRVVRKITARQTIANSKRHLTYCYHLDNEDGRHKVCKSFFLQTLGIKEDIVYGAWNKVK